MNGSITFTDGIVTYSGTCSSGSMNGTMNGPFTQGGDQGTITGTWSLSRQ